MVCASVRLNGAIGWPLRWHEEVCRHFKLIANIASSPAGKIKPMTERLQHILIAISRPRCLTRACVVVALLPVTTIAVPALGGEVDKEAFAVAAGLEDTMNRIGQDYVAHYAVEHYFSSNSSEPSLVRNGIIERKGNNIRYSIQCPNDTPPEPQDRDGLQGVPCLQ